MAHTITFSFNLFDMPCFFSAKASSKSTTFSGNLNEQTITIQLISDNCLGIKKPNEAVERFFYNRVKITITDELNDLQRSDFRYLLISYQQVAINIINRIISYFKYEMRNPHLRNISHIDLLKKQEFELYNPEWRTLDGKPLKVAEAPITSGILSMPGTAFLQDNFFGITPFTEENTITIQQHVFSEQINSLADELLSDAQASAFHNNFRRSVLELAISIEVFVKNFFFKREKITGSAFEYLEDKGRESIKVIELLDGASLYAFNESFKNHSPQAYKDIDYIFRCRNKIAHRGEPKYKDDAGRWHEVNFDLLGSWWKSTLEMFDWLKTKAQTEN